MTTALTESVSIQVWIQSFISSRVHKREQCVPLYQYQMSQSEYASLRLCLSRSRGFSVTSASTNEWCGAFTLYCAEWFRREYTRDWSWEPIYASLEFRLEPNAIADVVERGLNGYWGRYVSQNQAQQHHYLGSVFREGGLPSNLLAYDNNNYQTTFYAIFERYQEAKELGVNMVETLIRDRIKRLPKALQSEDSIALITNMVDQLDSLVYRFDLENQPNPAQYLDSQVPQWRESFPLPIEDSAGSAFLSQLLSRATNEVKKAGTQRGPLACTHYICLVNQALFSDINFPKDLVFDVSKSKLASSRLELVIVEGDNVVASLGAVFAQFEYDQTVIRVRQPKVRIKRTDAASELYITVMQAGNKLAEIRLSSSSIDVGETPITVQQSDDLWRVLGQASIRTKATQVGVFLPDTAHFEVEYGSVTPSERRFSGLIFCQFEGRAQVITEQNGRYTITTGAEQFEDNHLMLNGELLRWKSSPALVFKGVPKVCYDLAAHNGSVATLLTYLGDDLASELPRSEVNGKQIFMAKSVSGEVMLRKQIGILPNDFDIQLVSGDLPIDGKIRIMTTSPCVCSIISNDVTMDSLEKNPGITQMSIHATGSIPPMSVAVQIRASILSQPIVIEVPFPSRGALAYGALGKKLPTRLTVEDLLGSRLYLFPNQGAATRFQIEAIATSYRGSANKPYYRWNYKVADRPLEISLYSLSDAISELLSLTTHLDSQVELCVSGPGKGLRYVISHYSTSLEHNIVNNTVFLRTDSLRLTEKVKPVLMSLVTPEQKPIPLVSRTSEGVKTGEFELPNFINTGGPWLIVPDKQSQVSFRAKFFPCCDSKLNADKIDSLQKASMLFHPANNPDVIAEVINQMSDSFTHSGWAYVKATYYHYGYLPLSTFEVLRQLVRNSRALALAVFVFDGDEKFITDLSHELSVSWEFIPIRYWISAIEALKAALLQNGLPELVIPKICAIPMKKLSNVVPPLAEVVENYVMSGEWPANYPFPMIQHLSAQWYQEMLQQHSEEVLWPTDYATEIKQLCLDAQLLPVSLHVNHNYHAGVVYLPLFAAALATGRLPQSVLSTFASDFFFHIRKLRDFDHNWYESSYRCFIAFFLHTTV
jgi:hypothetical protein